MLAHARALIHSPEVPTPQRAHSRLRCWGSDFSEEGVAVMEN